MAMKCLHNQLTCTYRTTTCITQQLLAFSVNHGSQVKLAFCYTVLVTEFWTCS